MHAYQYSIEFLSMHFGSWRPVENIVSAHISSRPSLVKLYVFCLFVYMTKCSLHTFIKKKRVTLSYHTDVRIPGIAKIVSCYRKHWFWLSDCIFAWFFFLCFFNNLKSGLPGLPVESVRAFSVSSLTLNID